MIQDKEIVYCNAKCKHKDKVYNLSGIVHKHTDGYFNTKRILEPLGIKEPVKLFDIEIISRLGFENNAKGFSEVKASQEKRNNITGAYE